MTRAAVLLAVLLCARAPVAAATVTEVHYVMGTYFRISAEGNDEEHLRGALRRCFRTARECDARFSRYDARSELSLLNSSDAEVPARVSAEMAALLQAALRLQVATDAAFDVSAGSLTRLWRTTAEWPSAANIEEARQAGGRHALTLTGNTLTRRRGVTIDLDGIAKGWAVDRCVEQLRADGVARAFLNFGESSLYALGAPHGDPGWRVAVRGLDAEHVLGTLTLHDQAVSVSAVFGRERSVGARRVGHIVDPRSGLPLTAPALAVAVADSATDAEAFSKAVLIRGRTGALAALNTAIGGSLLVRPGGIEREGRINFVPAVTARRITAAVEPLR